MDATKLVTPSDTGKTIKQTHLFLIGNIGVIVLALIGTVLWIVLAAKDNKYPYEKYTRTTGPPGTQKMHNYKPVSDGGTSGTTTNGTTTNGTATNGTTTNGTATNGAATGAPSSNTPSSGGSPPYAG